MNRRRQRQEPEPPWPGIPRHRNGRRPVERVDPILINLMDRLNTIPPGEPDDITENALVNGIHLAIELAEPEEQISIVPRIMSAEDLAQERLERPEVLDVEQQAILSPGEIGLLLRNTPSPQLDELSSRGRYHGDCIACFGDATVRLGCNCAYCLPCLRRLLRLELTQTGVFPPRCCNQGLSERTVRRVRRPGLVHLYRQRGSEADVPAAQRLYCHDGGCGTFIPPHAGGACPICRQETCAGCRGPAHPRGFRCQGGEVVEDVWETMDRNGLVNCPECGSMVQLGDGCNHMTCPCRAQFCYLCGQTWRTCRCPQYRSEHLRTRIADRPGNKPERYRRQVMHRDQALDQRIPQLQVVPGEEVYPAEWPTQTVQNFTPPRNNLEALEQAARGLAPAAGPRGGLFQRRREMVRMVDLPPPPVRGGFGGQAGFNEEPRRLDRDRDVIMGNGPELEPIVRARDRTEARRNAVLDGRRRVEERIARWDPPRVLEDTGLLRFGETQQEERERIRLEELDRARQRAENVAWNIELAMAHQRELDRGVQQGERERARRRERDRAQQRDLDLTMQMLERETGQQLLARADARFATVMAERRGGDARHGRAHRGYQHQPEFRRPR